jgi:hypothetical protein
MSSDGDIIWVASFDIGKVNFCFHIGQVDVKRMRELPKIPRAKRYNPNGTMTDAYAKVVGVGIKSGVSIVFQNSDLTEGCPKGAYLDSEMYHNMTQLLDKYADYWNKCSYFLIEQQMSFGKKHNTMALKLGQHCYSYFAILYGRFKTVVDFPAYHKTQLLGAEKIERKTKAGKISYKAVDKPARKKWAIEKAKELLSMRGEDDMLEHLCTSKKKDDIADVLCQLEAWKIMTFLD